jgi:arylformamidase
MNKTIIDISWPISPKMTQYKTKKEVLFTETKNILTQGVEENLIQLGSHTGTHIDTPAHFIQNGSRNIDLEKLNGHCVVIDATTINETINADFLAQQQIDPTINRLLFKTKNSFLKNTDPFTPNFIALDPSAAQWCIDHEITVIGIDYLGIEHSNPTHKVHLILLSNDVLIIEGLRLNHVAPATYELNCLPLAIDQLEAVPARAILKPL